MIYEINKVGVNIDNNIGKITSTIIGAFVTWRISDALLELLYDSIDESIVNSPDNVSSLLLAIRWVVGVLAFDVTSFVLVTIGAFLIFFKTLDE